MAFSSSPFASERAPGAGVTAVLGPTNTGKTHLAIERMLAHPSGLIGLPLRLLAREVYNKIAARVGSEAVALVTGEEKIKPKNPRYWVSTVEAMPRDLDVSFLAVDEVQIASDLERGHVFTDRILNRRGRDETLLLGAATMRPIIERLLPGVSMITRPRLSQLEFAGDRKITRQPRRTAIVAFSADEVYAIAELIRRQHGGAAVVLGSLSPRTRNAQVAMFQNGDVDYLVATDAVGMGLNLDVDHVAFASDRKFDGYQFRRLTPAEFAQIAGRAGRATRNGTFGTTGRCGPFEPELVNALQNHTFDNVKMLQWRNSKLDFASLGALQVSLNQSPGHEALTRAPIAEDMRVLDHAARDVEVRDIAHGKAAVERLWDACQVPDYRKLSPAAHAELVTTLYGFLMQKGCIPDSWFAAQVDQADRIDGDIDTLSARIAQIRTWTFVANRPDWLKDPERWQGIAREVENKLSDALHERLTERFVDRRTSVLMRRLRENTSLNTEIGKTGEVIVEGHVIGRLDGFTFAPDAAEAGSDAKALQAAAQAVLAGEINARAEKLGNAPDDQFVLTSEGTIRWTGDAVARLSAAEEALQPRIRIISDERLTGAPREKVQARLELWLKTHIEKLLGPMFELSKAEDVTGIARGIAYQLVEALGVLERPKIANELKDLDQPSRAVLRKYGVRFGAYHIYFPGLLKPAGRALAALLWALKQDNVDLSSLSGAQHLASSGRTSFPVDKQLPRDAYRVLGYKQAGERAVRVDILERLADLIRPALAWRDNSPGEKPAGAFDGRSFVVTQAMTSLTGSAGEDFASVLRALGYRMEKRAPLPPKPVAVAAETPAAEASAEAPTESTATDDVAASADTAIEAAAEPVTVEDAPGMEQHDEPAHEEPALEASPDAPVTPEDAPGIAPPAEEAAAAPTEAVEAAPAEAAATEAAASADAAAPVEAAAAPAELVEVWRPGGRHEDRKPRHERHRHQRHHNQRPQAGVEAGAAPAEGEAAQAADGEKRGERHRHGGHRRDGGRDFRKPREGGAEGAPRQEGRDDRNRRFEGKDRDNKDRDRNKGKFGGERDKGRDNRGRDRDKGRDRQGGPSLRPYASSANPRERDRPADPNSPFAKLAALKEQLSGRKE
ncbi:MULTISPECIES: helicase-related protein [Bradyrhizobium]|uniref:helicase-related protein n=1 Tax=Bradyrhizobium TaxID=374 RepID=UPI000231C2F2|nr:helicase-related protein [Bradyrhizobium japonicum]AJA59134.1 helicase [Bradyrhizobium japonicum]KMJ93400.1 helicase [Bradyrhizobium japonicum]MCS3536241.1 ATP-dependent RNA helicase SUPV3L1/SUV3 [Bradyrhizobium japonicum]MCS3987658.1 ATP-dependent RNA helicase SUPV3L1/SUV3 [Bradyrhizobium japonicum]MCS4017524.1 ATP-dependent RNA helicase SUPV3L1/SUV3 [Bradyrhizobium japonicum]